MIRRFGLCRERLPEVETGLPGRRWLASVCFVLVAVAPAPGQSPPARESVAERPRAQTTAGLPVLAEPSPLVAAVGEGPATPAATFLPAFLGPLSLAWGAIAEPGNAAASTPGQVAEYVELLQAHGWTFRRVSELAAGAPPGPSVLLSFDDPVSALRYVVPLLELYQLSAVVTVTPEQAKDPALVPTLAALGRSPWVELLPRIDTPPPGAAEELRCGSPAPGAEARRDSADAGLSRSLTDTVKRLGEIAGASPVGVAWGPGAWSGATEAVAKSLGLRVQLPTFAAMPPVLESPRVPRYRVPPWAGIWAPVQAAAHWDPHDHPVRFVDVDAGWICAGGDPQQRTQRLLSVIQRLALNGVRLHAGSPSGAWFDTPSAPVLGQVVGPLVRALRRAGVRWIAVDLPAGGDPGRDIAFAQDLARVADPDVAILPVGATPGDRLGEAVGYERPGARLAWSQPGAAQEFAIAPVVAGRAAVRGLTLTASTPAEVNRQAQTRAIAGWQWIGLPVALAESGLARSLRSLSAFALPGAGDRPPPAN